MFQSSWGESKANIWARKAAGNKRSQETASPVYAHPGTSTSSRRNAYPGKPIRPANIATYAEPRNMQLYAANLRSRQPVQYASNQYASSNFGLPVIAIRAQFPIA